MNAIEIDIGLYTPLEIDLSQFDFTGVSKVILTIRNMFSGETIADFDFSTAEKHVIMITPEISRKLRYDAEYDFNIVTDAGQRLKNSENGKIILIRGCGECSPYESTT